MSDTANQTTTTTTSGAAVPPTPAGDSGAPLTATPAAATAPTPATAGAGSTVAAQPSAKPEEAAHHNFGTKMLFGILNALGGTEEATYERDPQTGKLVVTNKKMGPGQAAKRIVAGALTGAAAGAGARPGPGQTGRAFSAGFGAVSAERENQDAKARQEADKDFEAQQRALVTRAQVAHLNQEIAASTWRQKHEQWSDQAAYDQVANHFADLMAKDPNNKDFGTYATFNDFLKAHAANADEIARMNVNRELRVMHTPDGQVHIWKVNPAHNDMLTTEPVQIPVSELDKEGTAKTTWHTIPAGSKTYGEVETLMQADVDKRNKWAEKRAEESAQQKRTETTAGATVKAARIRADAELQKVKEGGESYTASPDVLGVAPPATPGGVKEYNTRFRKFLSSDDYKKVQQMRLSKDQFDGIISRMAKGDYNGADSVAGLFTAIGISVTPLEGKGMRVNRDTVHEHIDRRGLDQSLYQKVLQLKQGDIITPEQLRNYAGIADGAYVSTHMNAIHNAHAQGLKADFLLPQGDGQQLDATNAKLFLQAAGGDADKARQAASQMGWKF